MRELHVEVLAASAYSVKGDVGMGVRRVWLRRTVAAFMALLLAVLASGTAAAAKPDTLYPASPTYSYKLLQQAIALARFISEKDGSLVVDVAGAVKAGVDRQFAEAVQKDLAQLSKEIPNAQVPSEPGGDNCPGISAYINYGSYYVIYLDHCDTSEIIRVLRYAGTLTGLAGVIAREVKVPYAVAIVVAAYLITLGSYVIDDYDRGCGIKITVYNAPGDPYGVLGSQSC